MGLRGRVFNEPLWLGENQLLAQARFANGAFYRAYRLDLRERCLTPCPRLSETMDNFRGSWSLSGDRKWVLWREGWLEREYHFTATRVEARRSLRWTVEGKEEHKTPFFGMPNSSYWIRLLRDRNLSTDTFMGAQLYDLDNPRWSKRIDFPPLKNVHPLAVLADGTILLSDWERYDETNIERRTITLTTLNLRNRHPRIQTFRVPVPGTSVVRGLYPTPDGTQLAWLTFQGSLRKGGDYAATQATLLVSDLTGRNARTIGALPFRYESDDYSTTLHGWCPDAKRVLLEARQQLFIIPTR